MMRRKLILSTVLVILVAATGVFGMKYARHFYHHKSALARHKASQDDLIRGVVKDHMKQIVDCYNQRLQDGLNKDGELKISWDITERGQSQNFEEVSNQLNDTELYDCSSQAISQWKFPKGIYFKVNYTFNLKQKQKQGVSETAEQRQLASPDLPIEDSE